MRHTQILWHNGENPLSYSPVPEIRCATAFYSLQFVTNPLHIWAERSYRRKCPPLGQNNEVGPTKWVYLGQFRRQFYFHLVSVVVVGVQSADGGRSVRGVRWSNISWCLAARLANLHPLVEQHVRAVSLQQLATTSTYLHNSLDSTLQNLDSLLQQSQLTSATDSTHLCNFLLQVSNAANARGFPLPLTVGHLALFNCILAQIHCIMLYAFQIGYLGAGRKQVIQTDKYMHSSTSSLRR